MPVKSVDIDGIGVVHITRRKGSRSLRVSVTADGKIRVSIPAWMPFRAGVEFAKTRRQWIAEHHRTPEVLSDGSAIGKAHHLQFVTTNKERVTTRVQHNHIRVSVPEAISITSPEVQSAVRRAGLKALRHEAEQLLPQRLAHIANTHGFRYRSVQIRTLKGKWGSCTQHGDIVLNCYLMQLPWELIDYVLIHELVHTKIMAHGTPFWNEVSKYISDIPAIRKAMRNHRPII